MERLRFSSFTVDYSIRLIAKSTIGIPFSPNMYAKCSCVLSCYTTRVNAPKFLPKNKKNLGILVRHSRKARLIKNHLTLLSF